LRELFHNSNSFIKKDYCPVCKIVNSYMRVGPFWISLCCGFKMSTLLTVETKSLVSTVIIPQYPDEQIIILIGG